MYCSPVETVCRNSQPLKCRCNAVAICGNHIVLMRLQYASYIHALSFYSTITAVYDGTT